MTNKVQAQEGGVPASGFYQNDRPLASFWAVHRQYLQNSGWLESKQLNASIRSGHHVPWITYPALHFLETLRLDQYIVVEFGAGASTLYCSDRANRVISYEFDVAYFEQISKLVAFPNVLYGPSEFYASGSDLLLGADPSHAAITDVENNPSLADLAVGGFSSRVIDDIQKADMVLIDGGPRNFIANLAASASNSPIVILDNSDMPYCAGAVEALKKGGYVEIPFQGLEPLNPYQWTTSFFAKSLDGFPAIGCPEPSD